MFVVKFWGGLGNQMFEYALFKQLEKHYPANVIRGYILFGRSIWHTYKRVYMENSCKAIRPISGRRSGAYYSAPFI